MKSRESTSIPDSYRRVIQWIERNDQKGWDPYDGLNTERSALLGTAPARLCCQYLHKFSPLNLRSAFGVRRSRQIQTAAFTGLALARHSPFGGDETVRSIASDIKSASMKGKYGYHCWDSHGFAIQTRAGFYPAGVPDVVGNEACGRFLYWYGTTRGDAKAREMAIEFRNYIVEHLFVSRNEATFFKYDPVTPDWSCVHNASALAAAYVMEVDMAESNPPAPEAEAALRYLCESQKPEGYWTYSIDLRNGKQKDQIDFHQGFILDCLQSCMEACGDREPMADSYERGLRFYREKQFLKNGQAIYRYPRKWPVNIQNQAQGIVTFSNAARRSRHHRKFAERIARWTIEHMQDPVSGRFYYVRYPFLLNRIPYIRWNDAGMAYALATFLQGDREL